MGGGSFFGNDVRRPYKAIAKKLNVNEDTVRNRMEKFRETGFIRGWKLGINPALFGRQARFLLVDVHPPSSKEDAIRKVKLIDGVLFILSYYRDFLGVHITDTTEPGLKKKAELIARISNSENMISMKISTPPCTTRLTRTDWDLIGALRKNPRRPFSEVADELGISSRTAKRRTERMVREGVLYTLPDIDVGALRGAVVSSLSVFYSNPALAQQVATKIISQFDEYLVLFHIADTEHGWYGFVLPNITKADEIDKLVNGLEGVEKTSMRLGEDFINLLDEALEQELGKKVVAKIPTGAARSVNPRL